MYKRTDIEFKAKDNIRLKGWFYLPNKTPAPCIIMSPGFSALKEHCLDLFAMRFAQAGFCVCVYDNRNFGESEGGPRLEVAPNAQTADMQQVIRLVQELPAVQKAKIGLWGASFSAGVVLNVAALDRRVSCVVAQVPFVKGHHAYLREKRPDIWEDLRTKYAADQSSRLSGNPPMMINVVKSTSRALYIMKQPDAYHFFTQVKSWVNEVTLQSLANSGEFNPVNSVHLIKAPILFILASQDTVNFPVHSLEAYSKILSEKKTNLD